MELHPSLRDAEPACFWLDSRQRPAPEPPLDTDTETDLLVVGGGYTGLWTALLAKERDPQRDVLLVDGHEVAWAASGRNGGFCAASLTHGLANGLARWPAEIETLERLGRANLAAIEQAITVRHIDCGWERTGELSVAVSAHEVAELEAEAASLRRYGHDAVALSMDEVQAQLASPTYVGAVWDRDGVAMVHPAHLAWGLRDACIAAGVRVHERTIVSGIAATSAGVAASTPAGRITAARIALATNAYRPLVKSVRRRVVPVYDHVLVTEPLTPEQRQAIGWSQRQGVSDRGNQFHYYRLTPDDRILWGGYDTTYHYRSGIDERFEKQPHTFDKLARHFFATFPQLHGLRFTHRWGGVIDTCSRFAVFFGTAHEGRVAFAAGYTGLGVGATRFGAEVMLDLLGGEQTARTDTAFVRSRPLPFPPEPLRSGVINLTRWSLANADRHEGRRNLWLRLLDKTGFGFDS